MDPRAASFAAGTQTARLPVYLLLDCSGSMYGTKLASVIAGVTAICDTLRGDPRSASTVHMSVIWFNDRAQRTQLVPITAFATPDLQALGLTALGAALTMLNDALDRELIPAHATPQGMVPGDYRPLVYLLTDGQPSDEWQAQAVRLRTRAVHAPLHIIGLAIGDDADVDQIARVATKVLKIDGELRDRLREYFDWVAESVIQTAEQQRGQQSPAGGHETPALPPVPKTIALSRSALDL